MALWLEHTGLVSLLILVGSLDRKRQNYLPVNSLWRTSLILLLGEKWLIVIKEGYKKQRMYVFAFGIVMVLGPSSGTFRGVTCY